MDHSSCSSSCSSGTSGVYSEYGLSSNDAMSYDEPTLSLVQRLEHEIGTNIHVGVGLSRFAQEVWGMDEEAVDRILAMPIVLGEVEVTAFREGARVDDLHGSFVAISSRLMREASKCFGDEENGSFTEAFWDRLCQKPATRSRHSMPDVINTWKPLPTDGAAPSLCLAKGVCELTRIPWEGVDGERVLEEEDDGGEDAEKEDEDPHSSTSHSTPQSPVDGNRLCSSESETSKRTKLTLKRSFDLIKDADDVDGSVSKKQRGRDDKRVLSNSLLPLYAAEAMASSSRYYVVGLLVDRLTVTVCYFDRVLVACVASFSLEEEPAKLALALYGMNQCDRLRAGFDPHLRRLAGENAEEVLPVDGVVGSLFHYPASDSSSQPACFRVDEVIRQPDELIGRATAVYKVQRRLPDGTFSEEELVYKLSWPLKSRPCEADIIETLKERLPKEAHDHFPDVIFTKTFTAQDLELPWLRLGLEVTSENCKHRVLRGMVGKFYHKLWQAGSIESFKKAWLDCVECLYLARKLGKVLHRDLSENNVMILKHPGDEIKGVLNDWDLAKFVGEGETDEVSDDQDRTGTPPFMAHDHLKRQTVPHCFRHDLESLFYILIWAALHYNLAEGTRDRRPHPIVAGWTGSTEDNRNSKLFILGFDTDLLQEVSAAAKPGFAEIVKAWIGPLQFFFANAWRTYHRRLRARTGTEPNPTTWGGEVTFKKLMAAINVTPRTWNIPNYLDDEDF